MTPKKKRSEDRAAGRPHDDASEATPGAEAGVVANLPRPTEARPALAFEKEPLYRELLVHFQSAEWDKCLLNLDGLLEKYPEDQNLTAFRRDVQIKSRLQQSSDTQHAVESRVRRRRLWRRVSIAALSGIIVGLAVYWFLSAYRQEDARQQFLAKATETASAWAAKVGMADTLMRAGRAQEALILYNEVKHQNPAYDGIAQDIQAAEASLTAENLYQQARSALDGGDGAQALKLLQQLEQLRPQYKDTPQLIATIERQQQIAALVTAVKAAAAEGDPEAVIKNYEAILSIDPFFDLPELHEALFASYRDLFLKIAAQPDPTLEEIKTAAKYYRSALALFPQSIEHAREKAELDQVAVDLLASQDYLQGVALLESSDYSIQGLEQSRLVLARARQKEPESLAIDADIQKAQSFIDSYDSLVHGRWDRAIAGFGAIYSRDPGFAGGRVRYFLYEAYTARGDLLIANGEFGAAFTDYQAAEKAAFIDDSDVLRIFQIELRVASVLRRMGRYDQSAEFYHFAFRKVDYAARLSGQSQRELLEALQQADAVYNSGDKFKSIALYESTLDRAEQLYSLTRVAAMQGDTLPSLAFDNGSSVWSLRTANDLGDRLILSRSQELIVPLLPSIGMANTSRRR